MSSPIKAVGVNELPTAVNVVPYKKNDTQCCGENIELKNKLEQLDQLCSSELKKSEEKNANLERQLGNYKSALQKTVQENKSNIIDKTKKLGKYTKKLFTGIKKNGGSKRKTPSKSKSKTQTKRKTPSKSKSKTQSKRKTPKEEPEMVFFYDMNELKELVTKHKIGSILEYNTENQLGTLIYKIVKKSGKKTAEIIGDYNGLYNTSPI